MNYNKIEKELYDLFEDGEVSLNFVVDFLFKSFKNYDWIGIYIVKGDDLVLGYWKGEKATEHNTIPIGVGVCGSAAESGKTENVADVRKDERFIACFLSTKSELVVPIKERGVVIGEIDIDSDTVNAFSKKDEYILENLAMNPVFIDLVKKHVV